MWALQFAVMFCLAVQLIASFCMGVFLLSTRSELRLIRESLRQERQTYLQNFLDGSSRRFAKGS